MTYVAIALSCLWLLTLAGILWFGRKLAIYKANEDRRQVMMNKAVTTLVLDVTRIESKLGLRDAETVDRITGILSDPAMLDAELERSAELSEARLAKRRNLRQPNAGPPAKVSRMRFHRN